MLELLFKTHQAINHTVYVGTRILCRGIREEARTRGNDALAKVMDISIRLGNRVDFIWQESNGYREVWNTLESPMVKRTLERDMQEAWQTGYDYGRRMRTL